MPAYTRPGSRGQTVLIVVLVIVAIIVLAIFARGTFSKQVRSDVVRILAGHSAFQTAQGVIRGLHGQLVRMAADPTHPKYPEIRRRLVTASASRVDLADLLDPVGPEPALEWQRERVPRMVAVGTPVLDGFGCELVRIQALPDPSSATPDASGSIRSTPSPDERSALVRIRADISVTLAGTHVQRSLTEVRDVKLALNGPPRPFEQLHLFVGLLSGLTDPKRANLFRDQILAQVDATASAMDSLPSGIPGAAADRLRLIRQGLPGMTDRDRAVPRLPEEPAALTGIAEREARGMGLADLDLARRLEADLNQIQARRADLSASLGRIGDGTPVVEAATQLARALHRGLMRMWTYQRMFRVVKWSSADYTGQIAPYVNRLTGAWYAPRVMRELTPDDPLFADWVGGRRELAGVLSLRSAKPVRLSGPCAGSGVLLVDAPEVILEPSAGTDRTSRMTYVVERGAVTVSGPSTAFLIVSGAATLKCTAQARLSGLAILQPRQPLEWEGRLDKHPATGSYTSVLGALKVRGRGPYSLGISPVPLWSEVER